jgi:hypothetical protein
MIFHWLRHCRRCNAAKTLGNERYQVSPFEFEFPRDSVDHWFHLGFYGRTATAASAIFDQEDPHNLFQTLRYVKGFLDMKRPGGGSAIFASLSVVVQHWSTRHGPSS